MSMKPTKYYSKIQEDRVSEFLGWETVVGSGATKTRPGDVVSEQWLGECKTHTKRVKNVVFKLNHWQKIKKEAQAKFKYPILIADNGTQDVDQTWVLFEYKLVSNKNITILNLPITNISTVSFDEKNMHKVFYAMSDGKCCIASVDFDNAELGVMPLTEFNKYFN